MISIFSTSRIDFNEIKANEYHSLLISIHISKVRINGQNKNCYFSILRRRTLDERNIPRLTIQLSNYRREENTKRATNGQFVSRSNGISGRKTNKNSSVALGQLPKTVAFVSRLGQPGQGTGYRPSP